MSDNKYFREAERLARAMVNSYPNNRLGMYVREDQREKFENQLVEVSKEFHKGLGSMHGDKVVEYPNSKKGGTVMIKTTVEIFTSDPKRVEEAVMKVLGLRRNLEDIDDEVRAMRSRIDEVVDSLLLNSDENGEG
jgi:hypothetical protein